MTNKKKRNLRKDMRKNVWREPTAKFSTWSVKYGKLVPSAGRPNNDQPIFETVAEKLPFDSLKAVKAHLKSKGRLRQGVYIAHDSIGTPRYIGRGNIFSRLSSRRKQYPLELLYYSFYVVKKKNHEREIETLLIRAAGTSLLFNEKKKRVDIRSGNVKDYEPKTYFYERQRKRGRKEKMKKG